MATIAKENNGIEAVVSCLASRSGIKKDAYAIDYQATLNCLTAGRDKSVKARHFVLLSAFCVKNPWLQFQQAKLKFEAALQEQKDMTWSIVRPTAFFKSVSGQLEVIQSGAPFVMFGDGEVSDLCIIIIVWSIYTNRMNMYCMLLTLSFGYRSMLL